MLFIRPEELKKGMRLARPVYNNKGVLLYDINTKLTRQGLEGIRNFGLLGVYVLEPAEPVPVLSQEDIEFERFQAMSVFKLREEIAEMISGNGIKDVQKLAEDIIRKFGKEYGKINFLKGIRSPEDYAYKHSLNTAILCAIIAVNMHMTYMEQVNIVTAALIHEVGMAMIPENIIKKGSNITEEESYIISKCEIEGNELIQHDYNIPSITRIIVAQHFKEITGKKTENAKFLDGTKVLMVADVFDTLTAMNINGEPYSDIVAVKYLLSEPEKYDSRAVRALLKGINILNPGVCIELNNGEKGLVIKENEKDILKPVVLSFKGNRVYDLDEPEKPKGLAIHDIMKTMDERVQVDREVFNQINNPDKDVNQEENGDSKE